MTEDGNIEPEIVKEIATSVDRVFDGAGIPGLE